MRYTLDNLIIYVIISMVILIALTLLPGCATFSKTPEKVSVLSKLNPFNNPEKATSNANWTFNLASIGVAASIFAISMGAGKLGWAGLAACIGSSIYSLVMLKYAWLLALGGLICGTLLFIQSWKKNRNDKTSLIDGIQAGKAAILSLESNPVRQGLLKKAFNAAISTCTTPEVKTLVTSHKAITPNVTTETEEAVK